MQYSELAKELKELKDFKMSYQGDCHSALTVILLQKILDKLDTVEIKATKK